MICGTDDVDSGINGNVLVLTLCIRSTYPKYAFAAHTVQACRVSERETERGGINSCGCGIVEYFRRSATGVDAMRIFIQIIINIVNRYTTTIRS